MTQIIKPNSVDFNDLVSTNSNKISLNCQSKMIDLLNKEFTEEENRWYIANLYIYMNYHPTTDFPINLETLVKLVGFAHKKNAKRTLENNFTKDEDYKIIKLPREQKQNAGRCEEEIMLNIDTFKSMCMLVKTQKSKEIRKYYVKLENIYNKIVKEEIEINQYLLKEQEELLNEKDELLLEQNIELENQENIHKLELKEKDLDIKLKVEITLRNSFHNRRIVYLIKIIINGKIIYKFGYTDDILTRLRTHKNQIGDDIELIFCIESKDNILLEKLLIDYLEQYKFRIKRIINGKTQTELLKVNDIEMIKVKLIELNNEIENEKLLIVKLKNEILDLKNENLDLQRQLLKDEYINELKDKIKVLEQTILDYKLDENPIKPFIENEDIIEDRIFKKRQVDKIDPTTLQIIQTYESINAAIIKNPDHTYNQLYRSIKSNNVYKDFRWNYNGDKILPTNKIMIIGNKVEKVIQLDQDKNFVNIYSTKSELCKLLHIGIVKLNKYIEEEKLFNDFYYINESSYDGEIPDECNSYEIHNSKQIKETNIETNEIIIYKTMKELYEKRGISRCTLRICIKKDRICDKYKWEYVNNNHNKNNSKKVKEINVENNKFVVYDSLKKVYTKLNITREKLRTIINNKEIINECKYEFC